MVTGRTLIRDAKNREYTEIQDTDLTKRSDSKPSSENPKEHDSAPKNKETTRLDTVRIANGFA